MLQAAGLRVLFSMGSLGSTHMSYGKGGQCVGLTTLSSS